jgi:hypothetical protein
MIIILKRGLFCMITITLYGIDPYLLRDLSRDLTDKLADLYEVEKDDIDFFAPEGLLAHDGVEQNLWNVIVHVNAPKKVSVLQNQAAELIAAYVKNVCVNLAIEFYYYSQDDRYEYLSKDSPRFQTEENSVYVEEGEEDDSDEDKDDDGCDECDHDDDKEEPYLGDAFADFNKKMGDL